MNTKQQAEKGAKALLAKMKTKGWKSRVWENLGWHYSIFNEHLEIYPVTCDGGEYHAMLATCKSPAGGSPAFWHEGGTFKDPNAAATAAVKRARRFVNDVQEVVATMERILG